MERQAGLHFENCCSWNSSFGPEEALSEYAYIVSMKNVGGTVRGLEVINRKRCRF